jgi:hypothetical protein
MKACIFLNGSTAGTLFPTQTHSRLSEPVCLGRFYHTGPPRDEGTRVFLAGVYLSLAEGRTPEGFSEDLMKSAFRSKKKRESRPASWVSPPPRLKCSG